MDTSVLKKPKILYIITSADGGGAQKYALDLARAFGGAIAAGTEATQLFDQAEDLRLTTYKLKHLKRNINPWHDILAIGEIYRLIKKERPDIVHLNSSKAGFLGSIAGKLAGAKVVFTAHGFFYFKRSAWPIKLAYTILERTASLFRDFIITVSEEDRQQAIQHHLINPVKIQTIHNGITTPLFIDKSQARKELGIIDQTFLLGNVAQLYNRKAINIFIEALDLISAELKKKIKVVIIGEGPGRQQFEQLIAQKNLGDIFLLPGYKPNAGSLIKAFDVFVLSSRREGFPYVILEAMQAGLPIIATDVGGVPEALGQAGILVPPENPQALADAITKLINNPDLMSDLSAKALIRSQNFTQEKMLAETEKIYKKL